MSLRLNCETARNCASIARRATCLNDSGQPAHMPERRAGHEMKTRLRSSEQRREELDRSAAAGNTTTRGGRMLELELRQRLRCNSERQVAGQCDTIVVFSCSFGAVRSRCAYLFPRR
jgi:hypothetical protein